MNKFKCLRIFPSNAVFSYTRISVTNFHNTCIIDFHKFVNGKFSGFHNGFIQSVSPFFVTTRYYFALKMERPGFSQNFSNHHLIYLFFVENISVRNLKLTLTFVMKLPELMICP